ncbi:hypothetical protein M5D96_005373 [Drosophila gunungcola]|uniref:Uncharacterized protein n=1 Tax=Drosophila gunungcola TaxID=103775 RepID=A0A9Q0BR44_9MUSC|nr:hypothetical protein M5D96_005373 [Drosophila gunungcola]
MISPAAETKTETEAGAEELKIRRAEQLEIKMKHPMQQPTCQGSCHKSAASVKCFMPLGHQKKNGRGDKLENKSM